MKPIVALLGLAACGTTGGEVLSFDVTAQGAAGGAVSDTGLGWHVELSRARLHIGAVYLNLAVPISGSQATNCILPGIYTAEELFPLDVDVLSTAPQAFPERATGTDDVARTGEIWLTGGNVNADTDSTTIAEVAGTASKAAATIPFTAAITISTSNRGIPASNPAQPSQHPICKQRIVSPIPIDLAPRAGGTLAITVDPSRWFANVDFGQLPADGVFPDDDASPASQNLFTAVRAAAATFQFAFH
ncbi:MAG TPA: hypothetical protein VFP84_10895 [Kofleriaceae bacterium]|nr:hypothetical protein [Kofleriaceae bacterium]